MSKKTIAIVVAIAVVVCYLIPYEHYDKPLSKGRYCNDAVVVTYSGSKMVAQIYMSGKPTGTYVELQGPLPASVHEGQEIMIGYAKSGLLDSNTAEVSFWEKGHFLTDCLLRMVLPLEVVAPDFNITNKKVNGTLTYNKAA